MKRLLPLLLLVAGCSAAPVAAPPSTTTTTTTTETTVTTTSPRLDTPRKLPADPCQVLAAADFDKPLVGTPAQNPGDPRSCVFQIGSASVNDEMVLVQFAGAYVRPSEAMELLVGDGHSAAVTCFGMTDGNGTQCNEFVAVNASESMQIIAVLPGGNSDQVSKAVQGYAQKAFARLLVTP